VLGGQTNTSNGLAPVPTRGCERRRVARLYGNVRIHVEKLGTRLGGVGKSWSLVGVPWVE
jgi:hypothetical protein